MKRINLILCFILMNVAIWAQKVDGAGNNIDPYVGTWVYQSNDTIFKIVFQKGKKITSYGETHGLYGGYYLSVKGEVLENYMGPLPTCWNLKISTTRPDNMYIWAPNSNSYDKSTVPTLGMYFYDKRKKHFNGEGISGGYIKLLSPKKLLWHLDEKEGIWWEVEGRDDIEKVLPIGFSVPEHAILIKEE